MVDFNAWLSRKYSILGQNSDADMIRAEAAVAAQADEARLTPARIANYNAMTGHTNEQTKWLGPQAQSDIGYRDAQTAMSQFGLGRAKVMAEDWQYDQDAEPGKLMVQPRGGWDNPSVNRYGQATLGRPLGMATKPPTISTPTIGLPKLNEPKQPRRASIFDTMP